MSFSSDIKRFETKTVTTSKAVFLNVASHLYESWVNGSAVTGAPQLPVDSGALRAGVHLTFPQPNEALIATNVEYAPYVEQGINGSGPVSYRVGGPHGLALSLAGFPRIVEFETKKVTG